MLTRDESPSMRAIVGCDSALAYTGLWPKFSPEAIDPAWEKSLDIPALDFTEDVEADDVVEDVPPAGVHCDVVVGATVSEQENHSGGYDDRALEPAVHPSPEGSMDVMIDLDHPAMQDIFRSGDDQPGSSVLEPQSAHPSDLDQVGTTSKGVVAVAPRGSKTSRTSSQRLEFEKLGRGTAGSPPKGDRMSSKKRKKHISRKEVPSHASPDLVSPRHKKGKSGQGHSSASPAWEMTTLPSAEDNSAPCRSLKLSKSLIDFSREEYLTLCKGLCGPAESAYFEKNTLREKAGGIAASLAVSQARLGSLMEDLEAKDVQAERDAKRISDLGAALKRAKQQVLAASTQASDLKGRVKSLEEDKIQAEKTRVEMEASLEARAGKLAITEESLAREKADLEDTRRNLFSRVHDRVISFILEREKVCEARGALEFRSGYLQTAGGQEFLRILHRDILDNFVKSNEFMIAAHKGLGFLIADAISVTLLQIGASQEQKAKVDARTFKDKMRLNKLGVAIGITPNHAKEWWVPIMDRDARHLLKTSEETSGPAQTTLYPLPCFAETSTPTEARSDETEIRATLARIFEDEPFHTATRGMSEDARGGV